MPFPETENEFGLPPMVLRFVPAIMGHTIQGPVNVPSRWVLVLNGVNVAELDVSYYEFVTAWMATDMRRFIVEGK